MDTYEKKYNEAMLRADEAVQKGCLDKDMFDIIFPPEESEDERINKAIFKALSKKEARDVLLAEGVQVSEALAYLEKQKEQKPVEWSEEDEKMRSRILDIFACDQKHYLNETAWFKSLPERFNPQPNQEWSEEDELIRKRCIADLGYLTKHEPQYKERYDAQIAWLKSLRPGWKPTDEQMKAFARIITYCMTQVNTGCYQPVGDIRLTEQIYEHLRNL